MTKTPKNAECLIKQLTSITSLLYKISLCSYAPGVATFNETKNGKSRFNITIPHFNSGLLFADISYQEMWDTMNSSKQYTYKLIDGGLLTLMYSFDYQSEQLVNSRLSFFPCYNTPNFDDYSDDYNADLLYLDVLNKESYPSAIRFDYDPSRTAVKDIVHPSTHLTLGQFEHCRIPLLAPLTPFQFFSFIIRNFYHTCYQSWLSETDSIINRDFVFKKTISDNEEKIIHLAW